MKPKTNGIKRIINALGYSIAGLKAAWKHEAAFRQEIVASALLIPFAFFLGDNNIERALLISSV